jgi:hypothetical protein
VPAKSSGTKTIANTFHRTGQLLTDHLDGRLADAGTLLVNSAGAAACGCCANAVIAARPYDRPLVGISLIAHHS